MKRGGETNRTGVERQPQKVLHARLRSCHLYPIDEGLTEEHTRKNSRNPQVSSPEMGWWFSSSPSPPTSSPPSPLLLKLTFVEYVVQL